MSYFCDGLEEKDLTYFKVRFSFLSFRGFADQFVFRVCDEVVYKVVWNIFHSKLKSLLAEITSRKVYG